MAERKQLLRWWALLIVTAITVYLCWLMLKPFVGVISWAAVLVIVFYPVHKRIERRTRRPAIAAMLSCVLVILVILVPVTLITIAVINELSGAAQNLQSAVNYLTNPDSSLAGPVLGWLGRYVDISRYTTDEYLLGQLRNVSGSLAGRTLGLIGGVISIIVQMFFVVFTMYYFFKDGDRIVSTVQDLLPLSRNQAEEVIGRTREVIDASVYGVISIAIIQGTLGGIAFWALGLPSAIIWGVAMTFLSMIPMLGAFIVWVPAAIYLALAGHWVKAVFLVAWGGIVIGMIDNFLRPKLVGSRTRLHELLIFFAVLGGLSVFGVLGVILGPVVLAIALALKNVFQAAEESSISASVSTE
ncbi:MAG TPA: AI-2E family transporter [Pyrinomonadaceae bacterium]|nr:AI-2E family transporter [Pyrinomonadaceae bacterium]